MQHARSMTVQLTTCLWPENTRAETCFEFPPVANSPSMVEQPPWKLASSHNSNIAPTATSFGVLNHYGAIIQVVPWITSRNMKHALQRSHSNGLLVSLLTVYVNQVRQAGASYFTCPPPSSSGIRLISSLHSQLFFLNFQWLSLK